MSDSEIDRLRAEAGRRDAYVHQLHLARQGDDRRIREALADREDYSRWLGAAEEERDALKARLAAIEAARPIGFFARMRWLFCGGRVAAPRVARWQAAPGVPFVYHLSTSPYRVFREPASMLEGWAFPKDGRPVTALRVRVDDEVFFGTYGLEAPEAIAQHGAQAANPRPGFRIPILTPEGRHWLGLEARLGGDDWVSILATPIWVRPPGDSPGH